MSGFVALVSFRRCNEGESVTFLQLDASFVGIAVEVATGENVVFPGCSRSEDLRNLASSQDTLSYGFR